VATDPFVTRGGAAVSLVGERVLLRPARPEDADAIAEGFRLDPSMGAMLGLEPEQENAEWLRGTFPSQDQDAEERTSYWFVMDDLASGKLVGEIGLVGISRPNRRAGLSVLVMPEFRRAGVGREAIELLVTWAQNELDLHRVELHTLPENVAMQRLAEAAGFQREGILRDYSFERGRFTDNIVYARLRSP
jgi:RimJ/RimL family protein N-acetyltransferase